MSVSIRRFFKPSRALQLVLVLLVLVATLQLVPVDAQDGVEEQQHQEPPPPEEPKHEDSPVEPETPPAEQEESPPVEQDEPPQQEEAPPVEQEESPPVEQVEETPPVQEEQDVENETPPVEEETQGSPPPQQESTPIDESLFELNVFECKAPQGDPTPPRLGPLAAKSVLALCFRPKGDGDGGIITMKSLNNMDFRAVNGPAQEAVRDNIAAGPMTRVACPMPNDESLCITATKLDDAFYVQSYSQVSAMGEIVMLHAESGEERTVSFDYRFSTEKAPQQEKVEHEYFEFPATPPPFPCGREIRLWILSALILTLLEFAFSPDSSESLVNQATGNTGGGASKTKKNKKE